MGFLKGVPGVRRGTGKTIFIFNKKKILIGTCVGLRMLKQSFGIDLGTCPSKIKKESLINNAYYLSYNNELGQNYKVF